ncbi:hypothetical protein [Prescottella equi]|nr:hypothetical protein [Prescottella equi]
MIKAIRQWWYSEMHPGRCMECMAILPEDTNTWYCSDSCQEEFIIRTDF